MMLGRVAFVLAILLAPLASAVPVDAELRVAGSVRFVGDTDIAVRSQGVLYDGATGAGDVDFTLRADGARLRLVDFPLERLETSRDHPAGANRYDEAPPPEVLREEVFTGNVSLAGHDPDASYRFLPRARWDELEYRVGGRVDLELGPTTWPFFPPYMFHQPRPEIGHERLPLEPRGYFGMLRDRSGGSVHVGGDMLVFLHGGTLRLEPDGGDAEEVWTGTSEESTADPTSMHHARSLHRIVLLLEGDVLADLGGTQSDRWWSVARGLEGAWDGDFQFADAEGDAGVGDADLDPDLAHVQVIGALSGDADYRSDEATWEIQGEATFVGADGAAVAGSRTAAIAAAVASAGLLALAAALAGRGLFAVTGRNVADPLGNETRLRALRLIGREPGVTASELQWRLGVARSTVRHHIRVLKRSGYVTGHKRPGGVAYTLNSATARFDTRDAAPDLMASEVFALTRHPTRAAIVDALRQGQATYGQMVRRWRAANRVVYSRERVSYHARKLAEAGVLARRLQGREALWRLCVDADEVLEHHYRAYLIQEGLMPLYHAVASGASDAQGVHEALRHTGGWTLRRVSRALQRLHAVGLLGRAGDGGYVLPEHISSP